MSYPKTREEWWELFNENKDNLRNIVAHYHPSYARWAPPMEITAPRAEAACDVAREEIEKATKEDPLVSFDQAVRERNPEIVSLLNQAWFGLPESLSCHDVPSFGALCDLCSEGYLLIDEN